MANEWYYTDSAGVEHTLCIDGVDPVRFDSEEGWGGPEREYTIEELPARYAGVYRAVAYKPRLYQATFHLAYGYEDADLLELLMGDWEHWHSPELAPGVLKRVTESGLTRLLDCVPGRPDWQVNGPARIVTQGYTAANPWWYDTTDGTANGTFNGATPVDVACLNTGEIASWPQYTITGIVDTPKVANADGEYLEVNYATVNADDTLVVDHRPGSLGIRYYAHGTGTGVYKPRTSGSRYWRLPVGTSDVTLTARAGTPTIALSWRHYYGSLHYREVGS